jgi:hypothetical protein
MFFRRRRPRSSDLLDIYGFQEKQAMGIPQGTDRIRLGPTEALRAVFVGIGRIIMAADRPQADGSRKPAEATPAADRTSQNGKAAGRGRDGRAAKKAAPAGSRWRSLDETGNVRLLTAEDLDDGEIPASQAAHGAPAEAAPAGAAQTAEAALAEPPQTAEADLPLTSYDTLSLASIRARLRTLDAAQLRVLVSYEQTHAERPEVLGMLERRIEKVETGG